MVRMVLLALVLGLLPLPGLGGEKSKAPAILASPVGTVLVRGDGAKGWLSPSYQQPAPLGKELLTLPAMLGLIDWQPGGLRLRLVGNVPALSPGLALESVAKIQVGEGGVLDLTVVRGRALVERRKGAGAAKFLARIGDKVMRVEMHSPETLVFVEAVSYWPEGSPFVRKADPKRQPRREALVMLVKGSAEVEVDGEKQTLKDRAFYRWSSVTGISGPSSVKELPEWAAPVSAEGQAWQAAAEKLRRALDKDPSAAAKAKTSDDVNLRAVAALSAGGLDDIGLAFAFLNADKSKAVRGAAATALHHYLNRGTAAGLRLYEAITAAQIKPGPATIIMELLLGFPEEARNRPDTFHALITYLQNEQQAIRHLAAERLERQFPQGAKLGYDASAPAAQRARAQAAWRKLVDETK